MSGTYTNLLYHIVFSTKNRFPFITSGLKDDLYAYIGGIIRGEDGILLEIGGMPDHVHLLVKFKPISSVSDMLRKIKANSSKWVNETHASARKFGWQDGFAAFTVSESQAPRVRDTFKDRKNITEGRNSKRNWSPCSKGIVSNTTSVIYGINCLGRAAAQQYSRGRKPADRLPDLFFSRAAATEFAEAKIIAVFACW